MYGAYKVLVWYIFRTLYGANSLQCKGTKRNKNGTPQVADANKTTCKTCNKQHKGICWKLNGGGNAGSNRNGINKPFNKK